LFAGVGFLKHGKIKTLLSSGMSCHVIKVSGENTASDFSLNLNMEVERKKM
jgi:hypothetical protein